MMLLNFHTHHLAETASERRIFNLIVPKDETAFEVFAEELPSGRLSVGIHPNFINEKFQKEQIEIVRQLAKSEAIALIGECGLDRNASVPLPIQEQIFIQQIRIAEAENKPVVVHCVRCFNELISIKKVIKPKVPLVVHSFNNKPEIARQLIERGFYFSFGAALLQANSNAAAVIKEVPLTHFFLENDDKDLSISQIYEAAASLLGLPIETLSQQIVDNWIELTV
jgi:TatD DNase family protein